MTLHSTAADHHEFYQWACGRLSFSDCWLNGLSLCIARVSLTLIQYMLRSFHCVKWDFIILNTFCGASRSQHLFPLVVKQYFVFSFWGKNVSNFCGPSFQFNLFRLLSGESKTPQLIIPSEDSHPGITLVSLETNWSQCNVPHRKNLVFETSIGGKYQEDQNHLKQRTKQFSILMSIKN